MYYTAYFLSVKIILSLYKETHLGNCFVIQSVNCLSQDMSVLLRCLVPHADRVLFQKMAEIYMLIDIFYTFLSCMSVKVINLHNKNV